LDRRGRGRGRRGSPRAGQHPGGRRAGSSPRRGPRRPGGGMTRLFGTNGIRGVVGEAMNADLAVKVGRAIGTFFEGGPVGLARDPRLSGPILSRAPAAGLLSPGGVVVALGVAAP